MPPDHLRSERRFRGPRRRARRSRRARRGWAPASGPAFAFYRGSAPLFYADVLVEGRSQALENDVVLSALGEHQRLRDTRLFFQYASVAEFCAPVEQITGRKVKAFHSSTDTEAAGHSVELFVLHPKGYDGPSRSEGSAT